MPPALLRAAVVRFAPRELRLHGCAGAAAARVAVIAVFRVQFCVDSAQPPKPLQTCTGPLEVQEMIATPLWIDGGAVYAADEEAAAYHWRVMRMVMKQVSFWEETY
jgi:hypothetical protein